MKKILMLILIIISAYIGCAQDTLKRTDFYSKVYGQSATSILNTLPSISSYSDNGTDFGYSYIKFRGIDETKLNFTLNSVTMNDMEDFNLNLSNYPDFLQGIDFIQLQRNFGHTNINFESYNPIKDKIGAYFGVGSFNSFKQLLDVEEVTKNGSFYISFSNISTDGYKYHSSNRSKSNTIIANKSFGKNDFRLISFISTQKNDLSWYGVTIEDIEKNRRYNSNDESEINKFTNANIQLHHTYIPNLYSDLKSTLYYVRMNGYYTYINNGLWAINLNTNTIGGNINYSKKADDFEFFTGANLLTYNRGHTDDTPITHFTYKNKGYRNEESAYFKGLYTFKGFNIHGGIQLRNTIFIYDDSSNKGEIFNYIFLNSSAGIEYKKENHIFYYSIGQHSKEPTRSDIFSGIDYQPLDSVLNHQFTPEKVTDHEIGYKLTKSNLKLNINLYYMNFKNELVLTGKYGINGIPLHINVDKSYRSGIEGNLVWRFDHFSFNQTASLNRSKIIINENKTVPILTPNVISFSEIEYKNNQFISAINVKTQSFSYIDQFNTKSVPNFYTLNAKIGWIIHGSELTLHLNNITNKEYLSGGMITEDEDPLYFIGVPFNAFIGLKINLSN